MASKKNKNLFLLLLGGVALYFYFQKKKNEKAAPVKTGTGTATNTFLNSSNLSSVEEAVSQAVDKFSFNPVNNSDRVQYAKDQKFCK